MNFDKDKLIQLKEDITHDDRPLFVEDVLKNPEEWASWEDVEYCCDNPGIFDVHYLNSVEDRSDYVTPVKMMSNPEVDVHLTSTRFNTHDPYVTIGAKQLLEKKHSIIITNFEHHNKNAKDMIDFLLQLFYYDLDNHGVWPARISSNSGHAHLYCGLKDSNSFPPHVDGPCNFIFQLYGENKFTTYENKKCALTATQTSFNTSAEERKELYDNLRIIEERVMKPGDMVYVPSRQYHYVEPLSDRMSLSFPLILKGPTSVML